MKKSLQLLLILTIVINFYGCSNNNKTESASNMISSNQSIQLHRRQWWLEDFKEINIVNNGAKQVKIAIVDDGVKKQIPELVGKTDKHLKVENIKGIGNKHATGMIASSLGNVCLSKEEIRQKLNSTQTNVVGINDFATLLNMNNQ